MTMEEAYRRQIHYANATWDGRLSNTLTIPDQPLVSFKPGWGFWTSTRIRRDRSHWREVSWQRDRQKKPFHFEVVGNPRILTLQTEEDVLATLKAHDAERYTTEMMVNDTADMTAKAAKFFKALYEYHRVWVALTEEYDAVWVPRNHQRHGELYVWDAESTVWFKPETYLSLVD